MKKRKVQGLKGVKGGQYRYELSFMRQVVHDYERGNLSVSQLANKYGLKVHNINDWRKRFGSDVAVGDIAVLNNEGEVAMTPEEKKEQEALKKQLAQLKKEVDYLRMKELALETMIDIAKEKYDIDLRKKTGTKPSGD